jgi:tartrate-resistant acid phosphatase type 5
MKILSSLLFALLYRASATTTDEPLGNAGMGESRDYCREILDLLQLVGETAIDDKLCRGLYWQDGKRQGPIVYHTTETLDSCPSCYPLRVSEAKKEVEARAARTSTEDGLEASAAAEVDARDYCAELLKFLALEGETFANDKHCHNMYWQSGKGRGLIVYVAKEALPTCPHCYPLRISEAKRELVSMGAYGTVPPRAPEHRLIDRKISKPDESVEIPPLEVDSDVVKILALGDVGHANNFLKLTMSTVDRMYGASPVHAGFILGDNLYSKGIQTDVNDLEFASIFTKLILKKLPNIDLHAVLGNHDWMGNVEAQIQYGSINPKWKMPYYYFRRNFMSRDGTRTCAWFLDTDNISDRSEEDTDQLAWLDASLADVDCHWKIVVGHHPVFDAGEYGDDVRMMQYVLPILEKHGVHLYMSGHEHQTQVLHNPERSPITFIITGMTSSNRSRIRKQDHELVVWHDVFNFAFVELAISRDALAYHVQQVVSTEQSLQAPLFSGAISRVNE